MNQDDGRKKFKHKTASRKATIRGLTNFPPLAAPEARAISQPVAKSQQPWYPKPQPASYAPNSNYQAYQLPQPQHFDHPYVQAPPMAPQPQNAPTTGGADAETIDLTTRSAEYIAQDSGLRGNSTELPDLLHSSASSTSSSPTTTSKKRKSSPGADPQKAKRMRLVNGMLQIQEETVNEKLDAFRRTVDKRTSGTFDTNSDHAMQQIETLTEAEPM